MARGTKGVAYYERGNLRFHSISIRELVSDPQFQSGYRDKLAGRSPKRFYFDGGVGERRDTWGYERGRLVAAWLLATGRKPPRARDTEGLELAYRAASDADAVL